jgi:ATP-binding cassette subfamily B protein
LSQYCIPTTQGVSLKGIADASRKIGLKPTSAWLKMDDLYLLSTPFILHWNQNHFVVLYKIDKKRKLFHIADPGKGKYKLNAIDFKDKWISTNKHGDECGIGMYFEPINEIPKAPESHHEEKSFRFLSKYFLQYKKYFFQILLGLFLGCILQLALPFLTQWIVDIGIKHQDINLIWLILLGELMIVFGRTATDFIRRWLLLHISMRINISLVSDFFIKLLKLPMSFFDTKLMGDILQRISDHNRVQSFLTRNVLNIMFSLFSFVIFGIVLLIFNRLIFGVFCFASLIYGLWIARFLSRRKVIDYELFDQQAQNQNRTFQFISSMQEIKLQDCEKRRRWEWEDTQADLFCVEMKSMKLQQTQEAGCIFINEIKNILITVFAATAVIKGQITLGTMLSIQYIVGQLNSPVEQLMQFVYSLQDVKISLDRINEIHRSKDEDTIRNSRDNFNSSKSLEIKNIHFKYDYHSIKNTLENISFNVPEGMVTAIVGASGSGKTTLIKLMLGFYTVSGGEIRIAGENINTYDLKWWRRHCGVVMQDGVIFSESIARNIAVDDGPIDIKRLENAACVACIHDYVMSLPLKFDTKIGRDGLGLSQGQKQRILIARAVYKNPDFIFLDEATNALDANNERAIVENLSEFYKGRTVVVVAHRLSTVINAGQIVVMEKGRVVEIGTHTELIAKQGAYFNLVKNQLELGN